MSRKYSEDELLSFLMSVVDAVPVPYGVHRQAWIVPRGKGGLSVTLRLGGESLPEDLTEEQLDKVGTVPHCLWAVCILPEDNLRRALAGNVDDVLLDLNETLRSAQGSIEDKVQVVAADVLLGTKPDTETGCVTVTFRDAADAYRFSHWDKCRLVRV